MAAAFNTAAAAAAPNAMRPERIEFPLAVIDDPQMIRIATAIYDALNRFEGNEQFSFKLVPFPNERSLHEANVGERVFGSASRNGLLKESHPLHTDHLVKVPTALYSGWFQLISLRSGSIPIGSLESLPQGGKVGMIYGFRRLTKIIPADKTVKVVKTRQLVELLKFKRIDYAAVNVMQLSGMLVAEPALTAVLRVHPWKDEFPIHIFLHDSHSKWLEPLNALMIKAHKVKVVERVLSREFAITESLK